MINVNEMTQVLNELLAIDPVAITKLVGYRVPCSDELAANTKVMCGLIGSELHTGILGILNGVVSGGIIGAEFNNQAELTGFTVIK
ncbi:hypothetical protein [Yersinia thracica]|uniref:hypothetical protein n=1 Tax=Yersinia thracica TaxID=2890319 RepID=UPI00157D44B9|nr:hypothetical protein [Yersinia thracica]